MLFYVNPLAIKNFFDEIFAFGQQEEAMYCFTDSMRPFVDGPFADEIKSFVEGKGAEVLQPVLDAAKAYGVAIDADEAAGAARAVAELAPLTAAPADDDDEV